MSIEFIYYAGCSTCKRAKKWLDEHGVSYTARSIVDDVPKAAELKSWIEQSGLPSKKFFNTSGRIYREENMKDFVATHGLDEQLEKLSQNGMLIKRPLLVSDKGVLVGFKEDEWAELLL